MQLIQILCDQEQIKKQAKNYKSEVPLQRQVQNDSSQQLPK